MASRKEIGDYFNGTTRIKGERASEQGVRL